MLPESFWPTVVIRLSGMLSYNYPLRTPKLKRLVFAACLSVVLCYRPAKLSAANLFEKSSINLPSSITAFEVIHDLDGDGLNDALAVYQRRVMVFFQTADGTFPAAPDIEIGGQQPIPEKYAAVAIGKVSADRGKQLLLIGASGVDTISIAAMKSGAVGPVEPLKLISAELDISTGPELVYLNCAIDMDGDGSPEIVLPQGEKLKVFSSSDGAPFLQTSEISLPMKSSQTTSLDSEPLLLGSSFFSQPGSGSNISLLPDKDLWHSVRYATTRFCAPLLVTDYNLDKRMDILSNGMVQSQDVNGNYIQRQSDSYQKIVSAVVPHETRNILVPAPNIADFNDDKIWDTYSVEVSAAKLSPRTDVSVYLGSKNRHFTDEPSQVLRTRDFAYSDAIPVGDVNGDGAQDIALFHLDFQASSMQSQLKAYLRNGLEGDLRFYLWDKDKNRYPDAPSFKHPVTVNYEIYGARQFFRQQVTINEDIAGSSLPDLVLKTGATEFSVYENNGGKGFTRSPIAVVSTAPTRFSSLQTLDLNQDDRGDVIVSGYLEEQDDRIIYSIFTTRKN